MLDVACWVDKPWTLGKTAMLQEWEGSWRGRIIGVDLDFVVLFGVLHKGGAVGIIQIYVCPMGFL